MEDISTKLLLQLNDKTSEIKDDVTSIRGSIKIMEKENKDFNDRITNLEIHKEEVNKTLEDINKNLEDFSNTTIYTEKVDVGMKPKQVKKIGERIGAALSLLVVIMITVGTYLSTFIKELVK